MPPKPARMAVLLSLFAGAVVLTFAGVIVSLRDEPGGGSSAGSMPTTASPSVGSAQSPQIFSAADQALARQIVRESPVVARMAGGIGWRMDEVIPVEYYLSDGDLRAAGVHIRFDEAVALPDGVPVPRTWPDGKGPTTRTELSTLSSANDIIMETALAIVDLDRREMLMVSPRW